MRADREQQDGPIKDVEEGKEGMAQKHKHTSGTCSCTVLF